MNSTVATGTAEACDFCRAPLAEEHQHLIEPSTRKIECACDACAVLFSNSGQTRLRRIPRRIRYLPEFRLGDIEWNGLSIPIGVAFIYNQSSTNKVVALYPSPGGPIESDVPDDVWVNIVHENPVLQSMEADV